MADFEIALDRYLKRLRGNLDNAHRAAAVAIEASVKDKTPVQTGRLRAAWVTEPPIETTKAGDRVTISNSTAYARAVEYGRLITLKDGTQRMTTGRFMVTRTVAESPQIIKDAVAPFLPVQRS